MSSDNSSTWTQAETLEPSIMEKVNRVVRRYVVSAWMGTSDLQYSWSPALPLLNDSSPATATPSQSATMAYYEDHELEDRIEMILNLANEEGFRDGIFGRTSESLNLFVAEHPVNGIQHMAIRLTSESMNQVVAADIVRILGQIEHPFSHRDRVYIAECLLFSPSPIARDAGAVALVDLNEKQSVYTLEQAVESEQIPTLKADMQVALHELMMGTDAISSEEA